MGDGYLAPASGSSARLRIEHGIKQKFYVWWKYEQFKNIMQDKPKLLERFNPVFKKAYGYYRCQSLAMSELEKYREVFYPEKKKIVPISLIELLCSPLSLAVWYMDDGYYYHRDKNIYLYLSSYSEEGFAILKKTLLENFGVRTNFYRKKRGYCFYVPVLDTKKFLEIVSPFLLEGFSYKSF
jgi:hypothetical protein